MESVAGAKTSNLLAVETSHHEMQLQDFADLLI
jgi:hypothetical protein